jgi:hypothetical protein
VLTSAGGGRVPKGKGKVADGLATALLPTSIIPAAAQMYYSLQPDILLL